MKAQPYTSRSEDNIPQSELISPVVNSYVKPIGGFWTSTYDDELKSDWYQWCKSENFNFPPKSMYKLTPKADAKILVIDTMLDLIEAYQVYPMDRPEELSKTSKWLDFEKMSENYDAIHLTQEGQWRTRWSGGDILAPITDETNINLYGWDCECTLWFRWCFEETERIDE